MQLLFRFFASVVVAVSVLVVGPAPAQAEISIPDRGIEARPAKPRAVSVGERALRVAASKIGAPYRYGAAGPYAFDCSGLTSFSYAAAGRHIPRTSRTQRAAVRGIAPRDRRRGDLVFFHGAGGVYHVGLYAGDNTIVHAPGTGSRVQRARIWSSAVSYGRVR